MGYLKVTTSDIRMKAKVTPLPRSGEVNLRARRLAPPPANGKAYLPGADQLALAQIAQRFAPGSQPPGSPAPGGFAPGSQPQAAAEDRASRPASRRRRGRALRRLLRRSPLRRVECER